MTQKGLTKRSFPGRLTLEQWLELLYPQRRELIWRAQCEVLGCERLCTSKPCRRHRTCCGADPFTCQARLLRRFGPRPNTIWRELGRLEGLANLRPSDSRPQES